MEDLTHILDNIRNSNNELLLRGLSQLTRQDLERLEQRAAAATELQMDYLAELLNQLGEEGSKLMLGGGDEVRLHRLFLRLCQYVRLAEESA
ncbi:hypothetical protein [Paenibacillus donghaensis]|uniref:Uncharacterized protein n=1 Tax=Paenibacillus donghaensis TaxID=414771 RepID=A0A2Z2KN02_9BACL|nr:hypothetical protein [Paenibacillus donghaensis]ASA21451.1 hypothetical protein B9T62_12090 [Paenibacillus donghaensis]